MVRASNRFGRLAAAAAFAALAAGAGGGAQARDLFTLSAATGVRYSTTSCDLDFTLWNEHSAPVDQLGIDVSVHDDRGNTTDTIALVFRYVEPKKKGEQRLITSLPCDRLGSIRIRRVWDCKVGGTAYGDCFDHLRGASYGGIKVER